MDCKVVQSASKVAISYKTDLLRSGINAFTPQF